MAANPAPSERRHRTIDASRGRLRSVTYYQTNNDEITAGSADARRRYPLYGGHNVHRAIHYRAEPRLVGSPFGAK